MTVASTTARNEYTGNGSVATYSYTFKIFNKNDLEVVQVTNATPPVESVLAVDTDYTVANVGETAGGSITLVAGNLTNGYKLIIRRKAELKQETDIRNQGDFFPETHENQFDKTVMQNQQQQDELDRSVKLPASVVAADFNPTLPTDIEGASNKVFLTNASGDGFADADDWPTATDISSAQSNASAAAASATAAANSATAAANSATAAQNAANAVMFQDVNFVDNTDSPITVAEADRGELYVVDASGGAVTITLPEISTLDLTTPYSVGVKRTDNTSNAVTINFSGTDTDNQGDTSVTIEGSDSGIIFAADTDGSPDQWSTVSFGAASGAAGDDSWTMVDLGSGQIKFNAGSRIVNGIVEDISSDITSNATAVAATNDTLTVIDASNGLFYAASASTRVFLFYDIVDDEFKQITNTSESSNYTWDYRNANSSFDVNLSRNVPIGYIDVTASANPGTLTLSITNFPVGPWTTFNNVAAAEDWQDWTPTLTATSGTISSEVLNVARYRRVGNQVQFYVEYGSFTLSTTAIPIFTLPIPASTNLSSEEITIAFGRGNRGGSGGSLIMIGYARSSNPNQCLVLTEDLGSFSGGSNRSFNLSGFYEIDAADGYNPISVAFPSVSDLVQTIELNADVTSTGDNATLSSATIEAGKTYRVRLKTRAASSTSGEKTVDVQLFDGTSGGGTSIGYASNNPTGSSGRDQNFIEVIHTFATSTLTVKLETVSTNASLLGNGSVDETYLQVEEVPQSGVGVLIENNEGRIHVNTANGHGSTNDKIRRWSNTEQTVGSDITFADSTTLGSTFTINKSGVYSMIYGDRTGTASDDFGISLNSSQLTTSIQSINAVDRIAYFGNQAANSAPSLSVTRRLKKGDVIRCHTNGTHNGTTALETFFIIERLF